MLPRHPPKSAPGNTRGLLQFDDLKSVASRIYMTQNGHMKALISVKNSPANVLINDDKFSKVTNTSLLNFRSSSVYSFCSTSRHFFTATINTDPQTIFCKHVLSLVNQNFIYKFIFMVSYLISVI